MNKKNSRTTEPPRSFLEIHSPTYEKHLSATWSLTKFDDIAYATDYVANGSFAALRENVKYRDEPDYAILIRLTDSTRNWQGKFVYVDQNSYDFLRKSSLQPGDIVIANVGDPGRVFRVPNLGQPMTLGPNSVLVRPKEGMEKGFLQYFFVSPWGQDLIKQITTGTAQKKFNKTGLRALYIPIAPLEQQKQIVSEIEKQFSRLDEAVANLKRIKANLKRYKAAVLKAAVEGKLTEDWRKAHPDVEPASKLLERILTARHTKWKGKGKYKEPTAVDTNDLPELPKGWVWARLEQLGTIVGGFTKNPKRANLTRKLPYLRVANIYANELRLDEIENIGVQDTELEKLLLQKGDLLIVEGNGSKDQIGRLAIWDGSIDPCVHQNHLIKVRLVISSMDKWILFWLLSPSGRDYIEKVSSSTSGLYTLSVNKVGALPLIVPSLAEQEEIITEVESRLSVIEALEATVDANLIRASRFRQSILRVAFSGQLSLGLAPKTANRDLPLVSGPFSHHGELV